MLDDKIDPAKTLMETIESMDTIIQEMQACIAKAEKCMVRARDKAADATVVVTLLKERARLNNLSKDDSAE